MRRPGAFILPGLCNVPAEPAEYAEVASVLFKVADALFLVPRDFHRISGYSKRRPRQRAASASLAEELSAFLPCLQRASGSRFRRSGARIGPRLGLRSLEAGRSAPLSHSQRTRPVRSLGAWRLRIRSCRPVRRASLRAFAGGIRAASAAHHGAARAGLRVGRLPSVSEAAGARPEQPPRARMRGGVNISVKYELRVVIHSTSYWKIRVFSRGGVPENTIQRM